MIERKKSPNDDRDDDDVSSISDSEGNDRLGNIQLTDIRLAEKIDLSIPLRRSFSSIDYVKHDDDYASRISRSRSTTLMNTPDHPSHPSPSDVAPTALPPSPPIDNGTIDITCLSFSSLYYSLKQYFPLFIWVCTCVNQL